MMGVAVSMVAWRILVPADGGAAAQVPTPPVPGVQVPGVQVSGVQAPVLRAARALEPIVLDGRLDEAAWQVAEPVTTFTQNLPEEGVPASERTEVRILHDGAALYVGAWLADREPVSQRVGRRDAWLQDSDWFSISLDTHDDQLTAYRFMVNPAGVRGDEVLSGGNADRGDDSWDPVWEVAVAVTDSGWTVEMRIPFSQLRFNRADVQEWGLQLERTIARRREEAVFAFTPRDQRGGIARYGRLVGLQGLRRGSGLELLPYVVGRTESRPVDRPEGSAFADPFRDGFHQEADVGLDLKYRLASNVTVDATVNPDFGQVEVDPAVINLSAYETRFAEKRPFFVEGSDLFSFGGSTQLVYSRRIGEVPSARRPVGTVYADLPEAATILGAAKLTGRTAAGWRFGVLEAVTAQERARYALEDGTRASDVVSPMTSYSAARVERRLRDGQTVLGGLGTAVHRRLGPLTPGTTLRSSAWGGGVDFVHEWSRREWRLEGAFAGSRIGGPDAAIAAAQRSSARYFQRPDAQHLEYDPGRTMLRGYSAELELQLRRGRHWFAESAVHAASPGFEVNDFGFQRDADRISAEAQVRYGEDRPGRRFRSWAARVDAESAWNYGGDRVGTELGVELDAQFLNYWSGEIGVQRDFEAVDDRLTRGGPLALAPARTTVSADVASDARRPWVFSADARHERSAAGARENSFEVRVQLKPSPAWSISVGPEYGREHTPAQYVGAISDAMAERTYGRRYLFAELRQTTVSLDVRLDVAFRPDLTLEVYAQPLLASGRFSRFGELRARRTYDFLVYGEDVGTVARDGRELRIDPDGDGPATSFTIADRDFSERSLRGNAVLRWEWRPGSTLFLVWQQVRESEDWRGDFDVNRGIRALLRAPASNVLMLKVTWWFGS
jgi:hypothetical protein